MMNYSLLIDQDQDKDVLAVDTSNYSDVLHDQRSKNTKTRLHHSEKHIAHSFRGYDLENGRSIGADEGYREGVQFGRELYGRLFEDANTIDGGVEWANEALKTCEALPEFQEMKELTLNDPDLSALGTSQILDNISNQVSEMRNDELTHDPIDEFDEWEPCDSQQSELRSTVRASISEAIEDLKETKEIMASLPGDEFGSDERNDEDRSAMIQSLSQNKMLKSILKRAGRLFSDMSSLPTRSREARSEMIDMEHGRDLSRLMNQPKVYLSSPETEDFFYAKFIEESLEVKRLSGKEPLGRGPLIVLLDESGSMSGKRDHMARSMACAILLMGAKEKRDVSIVSFNRDIRFLHELNQKDKTCRFSDLQRSNPLTYENHTLISLIKDLSSRSPSGGTSFDGPLCFGLTINEERNQKNGDLLVITDGNANANNDTIERVKKAKKDGLRVWLILIGGSASDAVREFSDIVIDLESLQNEGDTDRVLADILAKAKRK